MDRRQWAILRPLGARPGGTSPETLPGVAGLAAFQRGSPQGVDRGFRRSSPVSRDS